MPPLISARIHCFYCGTRTQYTKKTRIRKFDCDKCQATNFLDENGEIADVPTTPETKPARSFATALPPNGSPPTALQYSTSPSSDRLFCDVCLKNQHFLTQCLANYVPPESDAEYDAQFPEFKRNMERRYPPVCPKCEPKVRERIRKSAYAAKSDILTKKLAKSTTPWEHESHWRRLLCVVEALQWASLLVQMAWHLLGVLGSLSNGPWINRGHDIKNSSLPVMVLCFAASTTGQQLSPRCFDALAQAVLYQIGIGAITCWYNPSMRTGHKIKSSELTLYYFAQVLSLCLRLVVWLVLERNFYDLSITKYRGAHAFMGITLALLTYTASKHLRVPSPVAPVFRNFDRPLIDKDSFQYPNDEFASRAAYDQVHSNAYGRTPPKPFPINRLAPKKASSVSTGSEISEPESSFSTAGLMSSTVENEHRDSYSGDAMDWEPIQPQQQISFSGMNSRMNRQSLLVDRSSASTLTSFGQPAPNPFYGQLPPAPKSMEHRLRNSANSQPAQFHPVPESKQQDWFQRMRLANSSWATKDYVKTVADPDRRDMNLAESKWTLKSDLDAATRGTGLEDLFNTSFNIADDSVVSERSAVPGKKGSQHTKVSKDEAHGPGATALIAVALSVGIIGVVGVASRGWAVLREAGSSIAPISERLRDFAYGQ